MERDERGKSDTGEVRGATRRCVWRASGRNRRGARKGARVIGESCSVCCHTQNGVECQRVGCPCISGGTGHCTTPTTCRTCYVYRTFHIMHAPGDMFCGTQWINALASRRRHSVLEYSADTNVCPRNPLLSLLWGTKKRKKEERWKERVTCYTVKLFPAERRSW